MLRIYRNLCVGLMLAAMLGPAAGGALAQSAGPARPQDVVLYDQTDSSSNLGGAQSSSYPEPGSNQIADDFTLTSCTGSCVLNTIVVSGTTGNAVISSVRVELYSGGGSLPGTAVYGDNITSFTNGGSYLSIPLPSLHLGSGHWWMSVAPAVAAKQFPWLWQMRTVVSGFPSVWQNPDNSWAKNCTTWRPRVDTCRWPFSTAHKDQIFSLSGVATGSNLRPAITGFSPAFLAPNTGGTLTVFGYNFAPGITVQWDGTPVSATYVNGNQLSITVPGHAYGVAGVVATNTEPCIDIFGGGELCNSDPAFMKIGLPLYLPIIRR